jgi:hypothetical protein
MQGGLHHRGLWLGEELLEGEHDECKGLLAWGPWQQ